MYVIMYQGDNFYDIYFLEVFVVEVIDIEENINNFCIIVLFNICVEEGCYIFEFDLFIVDELYYFVYQCCCCNNMIINIFDFVVFGFIYIIEVILEV